MSRKDHKRLVGIESGQIHEFESDKLISPLSKIVSKTEFKFTNRKLKILEKTVLFYGGAVKHCPR